jgi:hypothetical protein
MLSVVMLSVVMLNVIMLSVNTPLVRYEIGKNLFLRFSAKIFQKFLRANVLRIPNFQKVLPQKVTKKLFLRHFVSMYPGPCNMKLFYNYNW